MPSTNQELARLSAESEEGQTTAEYAVVLGVITLAIVTTFAVLSGGIQSILQQVVGLF